MRSVVVINVWMSRDASPHKCSSSNSTCDGDSDIRAFIYVLAQKPNGHLQQVRLNEASS